MSGTRAGSRLTCLDRLVVSDSHMGTSCRDKQRMARGGPCELLLKTLGLELGVAKSACQARHKVVLVANEDARKQPVEKCETKESWICAEYLRSVIPRTLMVAI